MTEVLNFLREMIPVQLQIEWGAIASVLGTVCCYALGWNSILEALVIAMAVDYISGLLAACIDPKRKLDSRIGFRGVVKKVMILLLVALAHAIDQATGQTVIQIGVIWFFIGNEGLSIIENAAAAGLPIPKKLREKLEQLSSEKAKGAKR
ncbi:phage holin family protein [Selenomonas artemidis]|uniref:phage holin family protein n=1 Tax=Selenomonas artemidis TaxID=671224 RepID=UPI0028EB37D5|nr:phage holin family protein [Selenomonas artemidis]